MRRNTRRRLARRALEVAVAVSVLAWFGQPAREDPKTQHVHLRISGVGPDGELVVEEIDGPTPGNPRVLEAYFRRTWDGQIRRLRWTDPDKQDRIEPTAVEVTFQPD